MVWQGAQQQCLDIEFVDPEKSAMSFPVEAMWGPPGRSMQASNHLYRLIRYSSALNDPGERKWSDSRRRKELTD